MKKILFVCTGNTCRSPMAEAIFNKKAEDVNIDVMSQSFGICACDGDSISTNSAAVLSEIGINFKHKAKRITENDIKKADMVFGLSENHYKALCNIFPEYNEKIYFFPKDISDPFGCDIESYRKCRDEISDGINTIIEHIKDYDK